MSLDKEQDIWETRGYFQPSCHEYKQTSMDEKVELLKQLLNKTDCNTLGIVLQMKDIGNNELNKDITDIDIIMGMSNILDHLLKISKKHD